MIEAYSFYGSEWTRGTCEAVALQKIPHEYRQLEADLYRSKWFDYRLWHPVHCTLYWAHCYTEAVRTHFMRTVDHTAADQVRVFASPNVFETRDGLACVIARQHMDRVGCRYEWAMGWAMDRFLHRGWRVVPRPNQLYGEEFVLDLADAWKQECAASLQIARSPHLRHSDQRAQRRLVSSDYSDWLIEQIRQRAVAGHAWMPLSRALKEGLLSFSQAGSAFGRETLDRAKRAAGLN